MVRQRSTVAQARHLKQAWFFSTGDAVTATPTVVGGTVFVGSWDGYFYAIDLHIGTLRWKYQLTPQPAVTPYPGENPRNFSSDGGLVTSSAWYEPQTSTHPNLVIFGGGYTLYALDADTGSLFWSYEYTGRPDLPPDPIHDGTRIFSSPVVYDGMVLFAVDVDGAVGYHGYVVAASVETGSPVWELETDTDAIGQILNDGCGNSWSSGTLLPQQNVVIFEMADCQGSNTAMLSESVVALRISTEPLPGRSSRLVPTTAMPTLGRQRTRRSTLPGRRPSSVSGQERNVLFPQPANRRGPVEDECRVRRAGGGLHRDDGLRRQAGVRLDRARRLRRTAL